MKTEVEIRMQGMQALIEELGLVETERFLAAVIRDRFNYTEWRRRGLSDMTIEAIAEEGNVLAARLNETKPAKRLP